MSEGKKYLIVSPSCHFCKEAKEKLSGEIESGEVKVVDFNSEKGSELMELLDINSVPQLVVEKADKVCIIDDNKNTSFCVEKNSDADSEE